VPGPARAACHARARAATPARRAVRPGTKKIRRPAAGPTTNPRPHIKATSQTLNYSPSHPLSSPPPPRAPLPISPPRCATHPHRAPPPGVARPAAESPHRCICRRHAAAASSRSPLLPSSARSRSPHLPTGGRHHRAATAPPQSPRHGAPRPSRRPAVGPPLCDGEHASDGRIQGHAGAGGLASWKWWGRSGLEEENPATGFGRPGCTHRAVLSRASPARNRPAGPGLGCRPSPWAGTTQHDET
jgi:hypothetical protein